MGRVSASPEVSSSPASSLQFSPVPAAIHLLPRSPPPPPLPPRMHLSPPLPHATPASHEARSVRWSEVLAASNVNGQELTLQLDIWIFHSINMTT